MLLWVIETVIVVLSMYTKIPMPKVEWTQQNIKYVFCAFPAIGVLIGVSVWLWNDATINLFIGDILRAVGITAIPLLITGGIHIDGFCDTTDAISCYGPKEKKFAILNDPHIGVLGTLGVLLYIMLYFALCTELEKSNNVLLLLGLGYLLSRILTGLSVVSIPSAKKNGLARAFADGASKPFTIAFLIILLAAIFAVSLWVDAPSAVIMYMINAILFLYCRNIAMKAFGGITGDLAGWWLQISELGTLAGLVITPYLKATISSFL